MPLSRRKFLIGLGAGCSAAVAALAGARIGGLSFSGPGPASLAPTGELLVVVFLRGGCDGLSLVAPVDDARYVAARGTLALPAAGPRAALPIDPRNPSFDAALGLHPAAAPLKELYDHGALAVVHACGLSHDTRSHFVAMDYMERGAGESRDGATGWLARHLGLYGGTTLVPALAAAHAAPVSLLGDPRAVVAADPAAYRLRAAERYAGAAWSELVAIHQGEGDLDAMGRRTIEVVGALQSRDLNYAPADELGYPTEWPAAEFGSSLRSVARMIKLDLGLQAATVDFGGWDTHEYQGDRGEGYFAALVDGLARGLHALYADLAAYHDRLTVVVMSEFGRRLGANVSGGTDHGHGNTLLVLGGRANGGAVYGPWPGLEDLDQGQDLRITTDYRAVLAEILERRLGNPHHDVVFPGLGAYQALGVVRDNS